MRLPTYSSAVALVGSFLCRFLALNPRGSLDYMLPGDGGFSEYVGESRVHLPPLKLRMVLNGPRTI